MSFCYFIISSIISIISIFFFITFITDELSLFSSWRTGGASFVRATRSAQPASQTEEPPKTAEVVYSICMTHVYSDRKPYVSEIEKSIMCQIK